MTRIIGGEAGGRRLKAPSGTATRPTSDLVREALFSSLESLLGTVYGRRFLDLFAGSGAVGLEARSRGAEVVLVESDPAAVAVIKGNARALGFADVMVVRRRAERLTGDGDPFDVVFCDPPYSATDATLRATLARLLAERLLAQGAVVVVERSSRSGDWAWPRGIEPVQRRRYGETMLWYGRRSDADPRSS